MVFMKQSVADLYIGLFFGWFKILDFITSNGFEIIDEKKTVTKEAPKCNITPSSIRFSFNNFSLIESYNENSTPVTTPPLKPLLC